jgi:hypothetical protein
MAWRLRLKTAADGEAAKPVVALEESPKPEIDRAAKWAPIFN